MNGEFNQRLKEKIIETTLMPFLFCDVQVLLSRLIPGAHAILLSMMATSDAHNETLTKIESIPEESGNQLAEDLNNNLRRAVDNRGKAVKNLGKGKKSHHIVESVINAVYSKNVLGN